VTYALDSDLQNSLNMGVMLFGKRASAAQTGIRTVGWAGGAAAQAEQTAQGPETEREAGRKGQQGPKGTEAGSEKQWLAAPRTRGIPSHRDRD